MIIVWKGVYLGWDCTCLNHQPRWRLISTYYSLCCPPVRAIHCDWPAWPWSGCQPSSKRPQFWWRRPREWALARRSLHSPHSNSADVADLHAGRPGTDASRPSRRRFSTAAWLAGLWEWTALTAASSDPLAPGSAPTPRQGQARPSSPRKVATDTKKSDHLLHLREIRSAGSCWDTGRQPRITTSALCCCSFALF